MRSHHKPAVDMSVIRWSWGTRSLEMVKLNYIETLRTGFTPRDQIEQRTDKPGVRWQPLVKWPGIYVRA